MQDMVERIVEMDKRARELTDAAKKLRVGSEDRIRAKKEELRQGYRDRANEHRRGRAEKCAGTPEADRTAA